jgi:flagellar basal-body rod protein FlgG
MMKSLYIASTGMSAQQMAINVTANNLANVSTYGYKKSAPEFQELFYETFRAAGSPTSLGTLPVGIQIGSGVQPQTVHKRFGQGDFELTENSLDIAIEGDGFFQVTLPNGATAYTRAGTFKLNNEGEVVSPEGFPLVPSISVPSETQSVFISPEGVVSVRLAGVLTNQVIGSVELARFVNNAGLNSLGKNIFEPTSASGEPISGLPGEPGFGTLLQGSLESSNVNIADEMVKMIVAQRAYELNSKAIQTSDEMLSLVNSLKR